jgi:hypothetical protein
MKMEKSSVHLPRGNYWSVFWDTGYYLTRIELRFWHIATLLMIHSRTVRFFIRFFYKVMEGKPWYWVAGWTAVSSFFAFIIGYLIKVIW